MNLLQSRRNLHYCMALIALVIVSQTPYIESFTAPLPTRTTTVLHRIAPSIGTRLHFFFNDDNNNNNNDADNTIKDEDLPTYYIRESMMVDMGRAADVLTAGFFKDKTNFVTYQWERLGTYLSMEANFPKPNALHQIFVACDWKSGKVLGLAEVDARMDRDGRGQNGPYMCNVAVDEACQRRGIASALVRKCEEQVQEWCSMPDKIYLSRSLYLKVRESNMAAIRMYEKLGYLAFRVEEDEKTGDMVKVMRKQLPKLGEEVMEEEEEEEYAPWSAMENAN